MLVGFRRIRLCPCRNVGTREREEREGERDGEREMEGNNSNGSLGWLPEVLDYLK